MNEKHSGRTTKEHFMKLNKRIIIALIALVGIVGGASAIEFDWQNYSACVEPGNILTNVGVGFGSPVIGDVVIPPIQASVEYVLPIAGFPTSFGGLIGITTSSYDTIWSKYDYTGIAFGGRASWHFNIGIDNLDTYSSLTLGYFSFSMKDTPKAGYEDLPKIETDYSQFYYGVNVGVRYFFTPVIGASVEVGYSALSYIAAGLTLKF